MLEKIILLLSQHRYPVNSAMPSPLTVNQITTLLNSAASPQEVLELKTVQQILRELEARGEILAGDRNRYCMAPPMALALDEENLTSLLFTGDRAYLTLAHQVLESQPNNQDPLILRPKVHRFNWIKSRLSQVGVRMLTIAHSLDDLPRPQKPSKAFLRSPWLRDPFEIKSWANGGAIQRYVPSNAPQADRWCYPIRETLQNEDLLLLPTGEFLWFEDGNFYELEPDTAILAIFQLDKERGYPLKIIWDEALGILNLQGAILPSAYARRIWRLSEPVEGEYRTRRAREPSKRPLIKETLKRLGCTLI